MEIRKLDGYRHVIRYVSGKEYSVAAVIKGRKQGFTRSRKALTIFTRDVPRIAQTLLDLPGKDRESGSLLLRSD